MSILNSFTPVVNPDGTISYFPNTLQSEPGIPFRYMVDMENMNSGLFSNFDQSPNIVDEARDLNEAVKRRTLFSTNFQEPYYLNTGIMNQAPGRFLDDAGLPPIDTSFGVANEPDDEEDVDKAKRSQTGIGSLINFLQNIPTPFNLLRRGIESLSGFNQRLRATDFGQSSSFADFLRRRRDRRAREDAARRGADKQRIQKLREFNQGAAQYFGGGGDDRPGGFGQGAGSFRESDPTATEGSF